MAKGKQLNGVHLVAAEQRHESSQVLVFPAAGDLTEAVQTQINGSLSDEWIYNVQMMTSLSAERQRQHWIEIEQLGWTHMKAGDIITADDN